MARPETESPEEATTHRHHGRAEIPRRGVAVRVLAASAPPGCGRGVKPLNEFVLGDCSNQEEHRVIEQVIIVRVITVVDLNESGIGAELLH